VDWIYLAQDRNKQQAVASRGHKNSATIKCRESLDWKRNCWLLKMDSAARSHCSGLSVCLLLISLLVSHFVSLSVRWFVD
jgi:hypothetical protein